MHLNKFIKIKLIIIAPILIFFSITMLVYQDFREISVGMDESSGRGVIDSLNRSLPIHVLKLIDSTGAEIKISDLFSLFISPFIIILNSITQLNIPYSYDEMYISKILFSDYLQWRDGAVNQFGGFSINIISYSMLLPGLLGLVSFPVVTGAMCAMSLHLINRNSIYMKIVGVLFFMFFLFSMESFVEAWKLFIYGILFVFFLFIQTTLCKYLIHGFKRKYIPPEG